jgi:hypothetical protein
VICGNAEKDAQRWKNWTEDSFLFNFHKTVGLTVASGVIVMIWESEIASNLISKAGDSVQKLGGMALSSTSQIRGIGRDQDSIVCTRKFRAIGEGEDINSIYPYHYTKNK